MNNSINLFNKIKKNKRKDVLLIKVGNQFKNQILSSEYKFQSESGKDMKVQIDQDKKIITINLINYEYEQIWVVLGEFNFILFKKDLTYSLIGQYFYKFELPLEHTSEIVDFVYDNGLYAVNNTQTYLLMEYPRWISNSRRTSLNPYQQWFELSEKKKKENLIFHVLPFNELNVT